MRGSEETYGLADLENNFALISDLEKKFKGFVNSTNAADNGFSRFWARFFL